MPKECGCKGMKIIRALQAVEEGSLILILFAMTLSLFAQVFFRYCLQTPLLFSEELSKFLQIWLMFGGIGYALRTDSHISMEFVKSRISKTKRSIVTIITLSINFVCMFYFLSGANEYILDQEGIPSSALMWDMSYVYMVIPIGTVITICYLGAAIIREIATLCGCSKCKEEVAC